MTQARLLVIGAGGNLGRRLVGQGLADGHRVTAFVRDADRFAARVPPSPGLTIIAGDARDGTVLAAAARGQDVVINTAGNVIDGDAFAELFAAILAVVEHAAPSRFWALAGAAILTIPYADRIGVGLPFVPAMYRPHAQNWRALAASRLDWSLMCPGPMVAAPGGRTRPDLRVSTDVVAWDTPRWARWVPAVGLSLLMKSKLPEQIVSYEDVAAIMLAHLAPGGPFRRHRVGVALPAGERGRKDDWTLGQRGGDG